MQRFELFFTQAWYTGMSPWEKQLVQIAIELYAREERLNSHFSDYSFVVFPMAKAFEGFLKRSFHQTGLVSLAQSQSSRFRVGSALNPDIHPDHRQDDWVYGKVVEDCGADVARALWEAWLTCRNQVFHYVPENEKRLSLSEAGLCLERLAQVMDAFVLCRR